MLIFKFSTIQLKGRLSIHKEENTTKLSLASSRSFTLEVCGTSFREAFNRGNLNSFKGTVDDEAKGAIPYSVEVEWVTKETPETFITSTSDSVMLNYVL